MSNHLHAFLREPLREFIPSDVDYDQTFDWFEYLMCLCHCEAQFTLDELRERKAENPGFTLRGPVGRFGWRYAMGSGRDLQQETEIGPDELVPERVAAVLNAGYFGMDADRLQKYQEVKAAFDRHLNRVRAEWL